MNKLTIYSPTIKIENVQIYFMNREVHSKRTKLILFTLSILQR